MNENLGLGRLGSDGIGTALTSVSNTLGATRVSVDTFEDTNSTGSGLLEHTGLQSITARAGSQRDLTVAEDGVGGSVIEVVSVALALFVGKKSRLVDQVVESASGEVWR